MMLGKQFDGIWHTGIEVYGIEYFFGGGGIMKAPPHQVETEYGMKPVNIIELGSTEIPQDVFEEFVRECEAGRFSGPSYNLIENNCNNFSDEASQFLLGVGIPEHIISLPKEVMATPLGQMLMPMLSQMSTPGAHASQNIHHAAPPMANPVSQSNSVSAPLVKSSSSLEEALTNIRTADAPMEARELCLSTLSKLSSNFVTDPSNEKFSSVSMSVAAIQKRIGSVSGGLAALESIGFIKQSDGVTYRISTPAAPSLIATIVKNRDLVDRHLEFLRNPKAAHPSAATTTAAPPAATPAGGLPPNLMDLLRNVGGATGSGSNPMQTLQQIAQNRDVRNQAMNALQSNPQLMHMAQNLSGQLNQGHDQQPGLDFSSILNSLQGASKPQAAPPAPAAGRPEAGSTYNSEVNALLGMGFADEIAIRAALTAAEGDMAEAVAILSGRG